MARTQKEFKWAHILTGGASGALDAINGNNLIDLDAHIVMTQTGGFLYSLDDDAGGSESSPSTIAPDINAGTKMHLLQGLTFPNTGLKVLETSGANTLTLKWNETDSADRVLSLLVGGANRSLTIEANAIISQDYSADSTTVSFAGLSLTGNLVMPEDGTVGASGLYFTFDDSGNVVTLTGGGLSLPTTLTFTGATTVNQIKMPDNLADALSIQEDVNKYITFITTTGDEEILFSKHMRLIHTATAANDHALEIDANAANFGDIKVLDINYITGTIGLGQDEGIILINIDESQATTGADVFALEVLATEGSADIYGLKAGALVGPVHQDSGTFTDMDSALVNAVNKLTAFTTSNPGGENNVEIFSANTDTVTIGDIAKFEELEFLLETVASGGGIKPTFEFSTGQGTWTSFTPTDGTDGMRHSGVIAWDDADIPTWATDDTPEYLIRITRTRGGSLTPPVEDKVQIAAVTEYIWDKNGDVSIKGLTLAGNLALASTGWLGLAVDKGRLVFTDAATDTAAFMGCSVGVGVSPDVRLAVNGTLRVEGVTTPTSGVGIETFFDSEHVPKAAIFAYDRDGPNYEDLGLGSGSGSQLFLKADGSIGFDTLTVPHGGIGVAKYAIEGLNANIAGPHIQITTASDDYPLFGLLNWQHDNIAVMFDSYFNGSAFVSSDAGSNFMVYKIGDILKFQAFNGINAGTVLTGGVDAIVINSNGNVIIANELTVGDHGAAATDMAINVCYGTGAAPTANTTTIGSLFIKYVA